MELLWIIIGILMVWLLALYFNAGWMSKWMVKKQMNTFSSPEKIPIDANKEKNNIACDCFENLTVHISSKVHLERLLIETCFYKNEQALDVTLDRIYAVNKHIAEGINTSTSTAAGTDSLPYINGISKCIAEYIAGISNQDVVDRVIVRWKANEVSITQLMNSVAPAKEIDRILLSYRTSTINQIVAFQQQNYITSFISFDAALQSLQALYKVINTNMAILNK